MGSLEAHCHKQFLGMRNVTIANNTVIGDLPVGVGEAATFRPVLALPAMSFKEIR